MFTNINTTKIKQIFLGLFLIGVGVISTYAHMTIQHQTEQLEKQKEQLQTQKVILEAVEAQLQEENDKLSKGEALR